MKLVIIALAFSAQLFAGNCEVEIKRTACPGKEDEMLKPYLKVNPTKEKMPKAQSEDACIKKMEEEVIIRRSGVITKKEGKAHFDGKIVSEKMVEKACK